MGNFKKPASVVLALVLAILGGVISAPFAHAEQAYPIAFTEIGIYPRVAPSMDSERNGNALSDGTMVTIECELEGQPVFNGMATISVWAKTPHGYLPNSFLLTGVDGWTPGVPRCESSSTASDTIPKNGPPVSPGAQRAAEWVKAHYNAPARFDANRGDCAWLASQALWQGGLPKSDDWTDISTDPNKIPNRFKHGFRGVTLAGRYVPALRNYLVANGLAEERPIDWSDNTASGASIGDLIVYDYGGDGELDHVSIVTSLNDSGFPTVTEHRNLERYWSWSEASNPERWLQEAAPNAQAFLLKIHY